MHFKCCIYTTFRGSLNGLLTFYVVSLIYPAIGAELSKSIFSSILFIITCLFIDGGPQGNSNPWSNGGSTSTYPSSMLTGNFSHTQTSSHNNIHRHEMVSLISFTTVLYPANKVVECCCWSIGWLACLHTKVHICEENYMFANFYVIGVNLHIICYLYV